jgi:lipopolysaccharide export system protein LptC
MTDPGPHAQPPPAAPAAEDRRGRDWSGRQRLKAGEALRYSRFVRVMKSVLPVAAAVLLGSVVVYSVMPRHNDRLLATKHSGNLSRDLTMTKSSFTGTDERGNPYKVTAAEVIQDPRARSALRAEMKQIEADMQFGAQGWINATAAHGWIDGDAGILKLDGGLSVYTDSGFELHTESATAWLKTNVVEGRQAVRGHGPLGRFSADSFRFDRGNRRLQLTGHVQMTLYPQKANRR